MKAKSLMSFVVLLLLSSSILFAQEKWSIDPRSTAIQPSGNFVPLPQYKDNFIVPNQVARTIRTPIGTLVINPNLRVHPDPNVTQSEVRLERNTQLPNLLFGSANTVWPPGGFSGISEGVYVSTDGGNSWFGWDSVRHSPITGDGGDDGPTIDKNGTLIISHLGYPSPGMFANFSTDNGNSFSNTYTITSASADKNFSGSDDAPSSPFYGRSYTVWSWFAVSAPYIAIVYTTNGGVTWSSPTQINNPPGSHYSQGCDIRTGPNGEVYVTWGAPILGSPYTEDFDGFAKSTNGGVSWSVTENAFDANGIRGFLSTKNNIRVNSFPRIDVDRSGGPRNGWIYVVGCDKNLSPAGSDPDIILHRSTDGGTTWSSAIRVNQDALNNGAIQWFPAVRVDEYGGVNVVYYDDRNVGGNQAQVFVSRSIDGGSTWTDIQVSDHNFIPQPISGLAGGYQGDYIGITSANNKVFPFWMDNSTGNNLYQAWTTSIDLGPSINHTPLPNTENLTGPYVVNCVITAAGSPIDPSRTRLLWSRNNPSITDSLLLTNTSGNNWTGNIPGNGAAATYRYYIKTADMLNRIATAPAGAPANLYSFVASADTIPPTIVHTPITQWPQINWPATINAVITDNIGVDSAWVNWYKNTPSTIKEFRLIGNGNNYSAAFNSPNNEVAVGDSVFYVIKARDISSNHNVGQLPATGYYKILITPTIPLPPYCACDQTTYTPVTGNAGPSGDDVTLTVSIGFNFGFMGHTFSQASICTNGFVVLGSSTFNGYTNALCGTLAGENPMLAPFWDDLNTFNGGNIVYTTIGTAPNRTFVAQWTNVAYFSGSGNVTMQIRLHETSNSIEFIYGPAADGPTSSGSVGESDTLGGSGHVYSLTPGSTCGNTTFSQTSCNDAVTYTMTNFPSGRRYTFLCPTGINPLSHGVPNAYSLSQNYPNPFNPVTEIKYSIPKAGLVKLIVYDVLGREVAKLVNEVRQPGNYIAKFDASIYASGVYFYKLEAGDFTAVKKMVLVK